MGIKFTVNGIEYVCETAADAATLTKLLSPGPERETAPIPAPKAIKPIPITETGSWADVAKNVTQPSQDLPNVKQKNLPKDLEMFLVKLSPVSGKVVDGEVLSEQLDLRSSRGLGPRFNSLRREFSNVGVDFEDLVSRASDYAREKNWRISTEEEIQKALLGASKKQ